MAKLHLLAHNNSNFVKVGDVVEQYKTKVASIGTGNGSYWAHLHHSVSEGLSVTELRAYTNGWTNEKVEKYYVKPACDYTSMFGRKMDVGKAGYDWLQFNGKGPHPGLDINGLGGGNTDVGYEYTSPCDGKVIYVSSTNAKDGWGKIIVIEEQINTNTKEMATKYYINSDLRNELKKFDKDFDHEKEKDHKKMAELLTDASKRYGENVDNLMKTKAQVAELTDANKLNAKMLADSNAKVAELTRKVKNEQQAYDALVIETDKAMAIQQETIGLLEDKLKDCSKDIMSDEEYNLTSNRIISWLKKLFRVS